MLVISMKQLLTKLLKDKTFRIIMILRFKIYFIQLLLISFGSTNTNMFFVLVFFQARTSELLNKSPFLCPGLSGFCNPTSTLASDVLCEWPLTGLRTTWKLFVFSCLAITNVIKFPQERTVIQLRSHSKPKI